MICCANWNPTITNLYTNVVALNEFHSFTLKSDPYTYTLHKMFFFLSKKVCRLDLMPISYFPYWKVKGILIQKSENDSNFCTDNYRGQRALLLSVVFYMHKSAVRKVMWFSSKRDTAWKLIELDLSYTWSIEMNDGKGSKHLSWLSWWIFIKIHWHSSPW